MNLKRGDLVEVRGRTAWVEVWNPTIRCEGLPPYACDGYEVGNPKVLIYVPYHTIQKVVAQ